MTNFVAAAVTLRMSNSISAADVAAKVCDGLAVHLSADFKALDGKDVWRVSHVATGHSLGGHFGFDSEREALACARALLALPVDWRGDAMALREHPHLADACVAIQAVCGGFILEDVLAAPAGSA